MSRSNHGKITWNILKPIIQGKLIFGPVNDKTMAIMKQANGTFTELDRLLVFVRSLETTLSKLKEDEAFRRKLDSLLVLARSDFVKAAVGDSLDIEAIEGILTSLLNDTKIAEVLNVAGNALECYSTNRFVPVNSERELEDVAFNLSKKKLLYAALYFTDSDNNENQTTYKLRMETDNSPKTIENKNRFWFPGAEAIMALDLRYHRGFVQIQSQIDQAIMRYEMAKRNPANDTTNTKVSDDIDDFDFETFEKQPSKDGWDDFDEEWDKIATQTTVKSTDIDDDFRSFDQDFLSNDNNNANTETVTIKTTTESSSEEESTTISDDTGRSKRQASGGMGSILDLLGGGGSKNETPAKKTYYTKQMPYPKYIRDPYMRGLYLSQGIQLSFFFALIIHVSSSVRQKIWFRESENLKVNMNLSQNTCKIQIKNIFAADEYYGHEIMERTDCVVRFKFR